MAFSVCMYDGGDTRRVPRLYETCLQYHGPLCKLLGAILHAVKRPGVLPFLVSPVGEAGAAGACCHSERLQVAGDAGYFEPHDTVY
jgi:hypothetical protein